MYNSVPMETAFFLTSMAGGAVTVLLYDVLRVCHRVGKTPDVVVWIEDVMFPLVATALFFFGAYVKNSGELRWHGIIGFVGGGALYAAVVKNHFLVFGTWVATGLIKVFGKILWILFLPVRLVFRLMAKPAKVVAWYAGKQAGKTRQAAKRGKERVLLRLKNVLKILKNSKKP